jgi:hypothetical protein
MCIQVFGYILCGLYGTYCITFCSALGYTIWKEKQEEKYIRLQQENIVSTIEIYPHYNLNYKLETIPEEKVLEFEPQMRV